MRLLLVGAIVLFACPMVAADLLLTVSNNGGLAEITGSGSASATILISHDEFDSLAGAGISDTVNTSGADNSTSGLTLTNTTLPDVVSITSIGFTEGTPDRFDSGLSADFSTQVGDNVTLSGSELTSIPFANFNAGNSASFISDEHGLAVTIDVVPEPSTFAMLGLGALARFGMSRRRKHSR